MSWFPKLFNNEPSTYKKSEGDGETAVAEEPTPRYRQIDQYGLITILETTDGQNWFIKARKTDEWISYSSSYPMHNNIFERSDWEEITEEEFLMILFSSTEKEYPVEYYCSTSSVSASPVYSQSVYASSSP